MTKYEKLVNKFRHRIEYVSVLPRLDSIVFLIPCSQTTKYLNLKHIPASSIVTLDVNFSRLRKLTSGGNVLADYLENGDSLLGCFSPTY